MTTETNPPERDPDEGLHEVDANGDSLTVNSTDNPNVPGGYYISQTEDGVKTTNVYNGDDTLYATYPGGTTDD